MLAVGTPRHCRTARIGVIGGLVVNGASKDEFELGGIFLAHDSEAPTVISAQSQSCLTDGEQELQEAVLAYGTGELANVLRTIVQDPRPSEPTPVEAPATTIAGGD